MTVKVVVDVEAVVVWMIKLINGELNLTLLHQKGREYSRCPQA
jgi:hypothetical protein